MCAVVKKKTTSLVSEIPAEQKLTAQEGGVNFLTPPPTRSEKKKFLAAANLDKPASKKKKKNIEHR